MTIYLFGVSNVGKTTTGELLAEKLGYVFYDLDDEVKRYYDMTLEAFVNTGRLEERDKKRSAVLRKIAEDTREKVVAVAPITYINYMNGLIRQKDVLAIELRDTPENIFDRLVFSDENDVIYRDDEYKYAHMSYYMNDIKEDIQHYGRVWSELVKNKFDMQGEAPSAVVDRLIDEFELDRDFSEEGAAWNGRK